MKCKDAKLLLEDGIISTELSQHLSQCKSCQAHADFLNKISLLRTEKVPMPSDSQWSLARTQMGSKRKKPKRRLFAIPALATVAATVLILFNVFWQSPSNDLTVNQEMAYLVASESDLYTAIEETGLPVELSGLGQEQVEEVQQAMYMDMDAEEMLNTIAEDELDDFLDFMENQLRSNT